MRRFLWDDFAQPSILGVFSAVMLIIVTLALMPTVVTQIDECINNCSIGAVEITLLRLIPLALVMSVIGAIFFFARGEGV